MQYRWNVLKPPYKYTKTTILLAANKKQQLLQLQIWKNKFLQYFRRVVIQGTECQRILCLWLYGANLELLFFNFFEKNISQKKKVKVEVFKVPVFVASLTELLSLCEFNYYRKIKENHHSQWPETKNLRSYLTYISKRWQMNLVIKFMSK